VTWLRTEQEPLNTKQRTWSIASPLRGLRDFPARLSEDVVGWRGSGKSGEVEKGYLISVDLKDNTKCVITF
jgi:hypothetical protein